MTWIYPNQRIQIAHTCKDCWFSFTIPGVALILHNHKTSISDSFLRSSAPHGAEPVPDTRDGLHFYSSSIAFTRLTTARHALFTRESSWVDIRVRAEYRNGGDV